MPASQAKAQPIETEGWPLYNQYWYIVINWSTNFIHIVSVCVCVHVVTWTSGGVFYSSFKSPELLEIQSSVYYTVDKVSLLEEQLIEGIITLFLSASFPLTLSLSHAYLGKGCESTYELLCPQILGTLIPLLPLGVLWAGSPLPWKFGAKTKTSYPVLFVIACKAQNSEKASMSGKSAFVNLSC